MNNDILIKALTPYWHRATSVHPITNSCWFSRVCLHLQLPSPKIPECDKTVMVRAYHNLHHVWELCELYDKDIAPAIKMQNGHGMKVRDDVIFLCAFFHDIVYDAKKGDNEEESAELFDEFAAESKLPEHVSGTVRRIILATKKHLDWAPPQNTNSEVFDDEQQMEIDCTKVFLDMDLAILGAEPAHRYPEYAQQIRTEWRHVADVDFCKGRLAFLKSMAARGPDALFYTDIVKKLRARNVAVNLEWEQQHLSEKLAKLIVDEKVEG